MPIDLADNRAREAALDTRCSHHVESPAGAGKTMLLTMRFVKLLSSVNHPAEILALTFTEKAAQEMQARIIDSLKRAERKEHPKHPSDKILLRHAEDALMRHKKHMHLISSGGLNIMTFHGFCYHLAARAPLEAGVSPDFAIMEEREAPLLIRESVAATIERLLAAPTEDSRRRALERRALFHDNNWGSLTAELIEMIKNRSRFADLVGVIRSAGGKKLSRLEGVFKERLRPFVEKKLTALERQFVESSLGDRWNEFLNHLQEKKTDAALVLPLAIPSSQWEDLPCWRKIADCLLTKTGTPRKMMGAKSGFYAGFQKSEWGALMGEIPTLLAKGLHEAREYAAPDQPVADMEVLSDLIIVASEILSDYETACSRRNMLDFDGLEQCALKVLDTTAPTDLQLFLDHHVGHILIDEFQDTNRTQWELLRRLVNGWLPDDGKTVFIVGDPKQSIYAFRNAEVSLFLDAAKGIPQDGGAALPLRSHRLSTNFRSCGDLIAWVNELFGETIMASPDREADEVPYSPSSPFEERDVSGVISLNLFADEDGEKAKDKEALWLAAAVKDQVDRTEGRQSIAVLLFTRNRIARYLKAFQDISLSIQVKEGLRLVDRPEAAHLLQTARLLVYPHDDLAWASLFRAPWSWCSLDVLCETALQEPPSWYDKLRLTASQRVDLEKLLRTVDRGLARIGRDPLGTVVRTFWEDMDGPRITASLYGMRGVANCMRFCEMLDGIDRGIPQETLERFESLKEDLYEPTDPSASRSPVEMMTIHRAKGLEFDIVYIPFMDWNPLSSSYRNALPYLLERIPGTEGEYLIATGKDRREETTSPLYRMLLKLNREKRLGESKRWFYVAATRAKGELHMSGIATVNGGGVHVPPRTPLFWIMEHEGLNGISLGAVTEQPTEDRLSLAINPTVESGSRYVAESGAPYRHMPKILDIVPEKSGFSVITPSSLSSVHKTPSTDLPLPEDAIGSDSIDRIRGVIIHRALNVTIGQNHLPSTRSITGALHREGLSPDKAAETAVEIEREVTATLADPFFKRLLCSDRNLIKTEWALEDRISEEKIRSGRIDFACFDGNAWWIVDFKTSRPVNGQIQEDFISEERRRYQPQIMHYKSMVSKLDVGAGKPIHAGIFLTALGVWIEI